MQKSWSYFHFTGSGNLQVLVAESSPVSVPVTEPGSGDSLVSVPDR